ncbi:MAG: hypothetical protein K2L28_08085 [Muribaculaceae bacterium]|nr:hypothetical protein [Muribaculaceae bacterium]
MKSLFSLSSFVAALVLFASCSSNGGGIEEPYNAELCEELAVKIERHDSLTQEEYTRMIGQNAAILHYLADQAKAIADEPQSDRNGSWRQLLADPGYMERFSYMFTIGSALYQADAEGKLDSKNKERYRKLDSYNERLADYTDRN